MSSQGGLQGQTTAENPENRTAVSGRRNARRDNVNDAASVSLMPSLEEVAELGVEVFRWYGSKADVWTFLDKHFLPIVEKYIENKTPPKIGIRLVRLAMQFGIPPTSVLRLVRMIVENLPQSAKSACSPQIRVICYAVFCGMETFCRNGGTESDETGAQEWVEVVTALVKCIGYYRHNDVIQLVKTLLLVFKKVTNKSIVEQMRKKVLKMGHLGNEARSLLMKDIAAENAMIRRRMDEDRDFLHNEGFLNRRVGQTYLTISQTAMTSTISSNFTSEKKSLEVIVVKDTLQKELKRKLAKNAANHAERKPIYTGTNFEGSNQSLFSGTQTHVDKFLEDAKAGRPLKEKDLQTYLPDKLLGAHYNYWLRWVDHEYNVKIAEIFKICSTSSEKKYVLQNAALDKLFQCLRQHSFLVSFKITNDQSIKLKLYALQAIEGQCTLSGHMVFERSSERRRKLADYYHWNKYKEETENEDVRESLQIANKLLNEVFPQNAEANFETLNHCMKCLIEKNITDQDATEHGETILQLTLSENNVELFSDKVLKQIRLWVTGTEAQSSVTSYLLFRASDVHPQVRVEAVKILNSVLINCYKSIDDWKRTLESCLKVLKRPLSDPLHIPNEYKIQFQTELLALVFSTLERQSEVAVYFMPELSSLVNFVEGVSQYTLVAALSSFIDCIDSEEKRKEVKINISPNLFSLLEEDYVIKKVDEQYTVSRPDQHSSSEYSNYVSSYASNLILHGAKFCNLPSAEWEGKRDILVTAVVSCPSKQARISIAETLYVRKEDLFDAIKVDEITKLLDLLKRISEDEIPDVHVYGRAVLTYFIEGAVFKHHYALEQELLHLFLQTAASCFCETELYLDSHSFEKEINDAIIATLQSLVHYVPFPSSIFSIFEALLHTGEIYVNEVLVMLSIYVQNQDESAGLLPPTTIAAVEAVMEVVQGENTLLPLCLRTLIGCIEKGQNVSVRVLEILKDSLFDEKLTSSVREKHFNAFSKAMNFKLEEGEQVGNELWDILEIEEISLRAIQLLDSKSEDVQFSTAKFLLQKLNAESRQLTVTNYTWMNKILGTTSSFPLLPTQNTTLEILATVTDNNQYIPESIIATTIGDNFLNPEMDLLLLPNICWLFSARIKHSKSAIPSVPIKLESLLLLHSSIDSLDNSIFFEAFTLLYKLRNQNGLDSNSIDNKLLIIAITRFEAAITLNEEINDQITEAMSLLASLLPTSEEVHAKAHHVAGRCFLATDYIEVGLNLLQCLPKIGNDLVDAALNSATQSDIRINEQIILCLQRHPVSEIQKKRLLRISLESNTEDILSAMENELGEEEPSYRRLSSFAMKLPELVDGHLDKNRVLTIITLMQQHEMKDLSCKPGLICNKETLTALTRMLLTAFETKNIDAGNILRMSQSVESIFRFIASYSPSKLPKQTLVGDNEVEKLLKLLQNSEVSNLQKKIIRELITLLVNTGIVSASSTRVIQIQTTQTRKEDPHNLTEVIDQVEKCPAARLSTSGMKFKEYLKAGTEFLMSASLRKEDMENASHLNKIHDYAHLVSIFVTKGVLKMISGYEALENVALFMTEYSSIVVAIGVDGLLGLSSKTLTVFCQIFHSVKEGFDVSKLSCLLEMLVEHRDSDKLKLSSDMKELLVKTCSKCVQMCDQTEDFKSLNAEKLKMFDLCLKRADSSDLIRFHCCQGLLAACYKDSTIDVSVLESIYKTTLSKTHFKQCQFDIQNPKVTSFLHTITLVSSQTVEAVRTASNCLANAAQLRVNLLSFELLAIVRRRNGIESYSAAEVIQQLHSQFLSPQESNDETKTDLLESLGNIYETLILLLSSGHQEASNTTSTLEILTSLLHIEEKAKWKLLVENTRHCTSLQTIAETFQEEALRSVVAARLGSSDIQIISTFVSEIVKEKRVSCIITTKILQVVEEVSQTDVAVLLEMLNFLADNQDLIKLIDTTLPTFPNLTAFKDHIYSSSIINTLGSQKFDEIYRNRLQTTVKSLLKKTSFDSLSSLVQVMSERSKRFSVQISTSFFRVLLQFPDSLLSQEWNKVIKVLNTKHPSTWLKYVNEILVASLFSQTKSQKLGLTQVLEKLCGDNSHLNFTEMHSKITKIKEHAEELMRANKESFETGEYFKTWLKAFNLKTVNQNHDNNITQNQICDSPDPNELSREESLMSLLIVANAHAYGYELTDPQILSVYLSCGDREDSGLLQQIVTGGGKSAILRLTAVMKALLHQKRILIATSNLMLAMRDARECSKLASLFNLTVDHNKDRRQYIAGPKSCYRCNIIYVEPSQLAFDILRHEYSQLKTLGDFKPEILLVDEVDSMLIDDSTKSARLTSEIPGMEFLQPIYHRMWNYLYFLLGRIFFVQKDGNQQKYFARDGFAEAFDSVQDLQERVQTTEDSSELKEFCELIPDDESSVVNFLCGKLRQYLESFLDVDTRNTSIDQESRESDGRKVYIPHHLRGFVKSQIQRWPLSLLTALSYVENIHYVVKDGLIQPVEFDTSGVIMENQNWSDGVHQFLQVRHNVPFIPESLPTNFLSSVGFFKRFKPKNIFGFTGTCGSVASKNFLKNTYKLDLLEIPSRHSSKCLKIFPDVELSTKSEWVSCIIDSVLLETKKCRGVMVFCRTIKQAEDIYGRLQEVMPANKVKLYAKNSVEEERKIERIQAEEVIVVTNLAGRGTDVKTNAVIERNGGLHLCVTFIPQTQRAEDQIVGRTARLEKKGTAQFILLSPETSASTSGSLRLQRDAVEEKTLDEFSRVTLPPILLKDKMFQAFCTELNSVRNEVFKSERLTQRIKHFLGVKIPTAFEKGVVSCVEEEWAYFIREMESDFQTSKDSYDQMEEKWMTEFCEVVQTRIENKRQHYFQTQATNDAQQNKKTDLITNPYYAVRIGNELAKDSNFEDALMYYDRGITLEDKLAAGAYIGRAWCIVAHTEGGWVSEEDESWANVFHRKKHKDHKTKAIVALEGALKCLAEERSVFESTYDATADNSEQTLQAQVLSTLSLIGNHVNSVHQDLQTVLKSKRLVDICQLKPAEDSQLDFIRVERKNNILHEETTNSGNYLYEVTFHDLILENQDGPKENDQLLRVAEMFREKKKLVILPMADASLFHKFVAKRIVHKRLTKDEALATLGFSWYERLQNKVMEDSKDKNVNCTINFQSPNQSPSIKLEGVSRSEVWTKLTEEAINDNCSVDLSIENSRTIKLLNDCKFNVTLLAVDCLRLKETFKIFKRTESDGESSYALRVSGPFAALDNVYNLFDGRKVQLFYIDDAPSTVKRVLHEVKKNVKPVSWENVRSIQVTIEGNDLGLLGYFFRRDMFKETKNLLLDVCVTSINADQLDEFLLIQRSGNGKVDAEISFGPQSPLKKVVRCLREANFEMDLKFIGLTHNNAVAAVKSKAVKSEQIEAKGVRNVMDSYSNGHYPPSLHLLIGRGLEIHLYLNERMFVPWFSVCTMAILSTTQIIAGSLLCITGVGAVVGAGLISEGCFDLGYTYRAYSTRQFNWKAYSIQKSLSVGISCASMGLGAFRALGNVGAEVVEQGAVQLIMNGKSVATVAGKSVSSMAKLVAKKVGVGIAETAAREVVFTAADKVATFLTDHLESGIKDSLTRELGHRAVQTTDNQDFSLLGVLNRLEILIAVLGTKWSLRDKVDSILDDITQSSSSGWQETLVAAGVMLGQKVAGNNFGVSSNKNASLGGVAMFLAMVKGLSELVTMCDFICSKLTAELIRYEQRSFSLESAVSFIINVDPNEGAEAIASAIETAVSDEQESHCPHPFMFFDVTYNHPGSVEVVKNISVSEIDCRTSIIERHEIFGYLIKIGDKMKLMNELQQKKKDWRTVRCLEEVHSEIAKLIVDKLSEQLTGVVRKNLMNPAIAIAGSSLVNVASTYLQQKFIINNSECSPEQFENEKKYDRLVAQKLEGSALSATENEFIESYGKYGRVRTIDDQMRGHTEYQVKMRNLSVIAQTVKSRSKDEIEFCTSDEVVVSEKYAEAVKNGKKVGGLCEVKHLLEKCEVREGVIICDGSSEGTSSGFVIKYSTTSSDAKQPPDMVFTVTKNGAVVTENAKCGFEVVEKITGVKTAELRREMSKDILVNKAAMARKFKAEDAWLRSGGLEGHNRILDNPGTSYSFYGAMCQKASSWKDSKLVKQAWNSVYPQMKKWGLNGLQGFRNRSQAEDAEPDDSDDDDDTEPLVTYTAGGNVEIKVDNRLQLQRVLDELLSHSLRSNSPFILRLDLRDKFEAFMSEEFHVVMVTSTGSSSFLQFQRSELRVFLRQFPAKMLLPVEFQQRMYFEIPTI